jgi:hypothetical protein
MGSSLSPEEVWSAERNPIASVLSLLGPEADTMEGKAQHSTAQQSVKPHHLGRGLEWTPAIGKCHGDGLAERRENRKDISGYGVWIPKFTLNSACLYGTCQKL